MRNEKGSITLYVLISMIFFLIIAMTAYVSAMSKLQGQNEEIEQIKASYEQDLTEEGLFKLYNKATKTRQWLVGSGTKDDTYKIYTIEDLLEFSNRVNGGENFSGKYIELMNDLDFRKDKSYEKADRTDFGDVNNNGTVEPLKTELTTGEGWQPIGTESKRFGGFFEGNKHDIANLYINSSNNYLGLFGTSEGTIQNLNVLGIIISTGQYVGGISGRTYSNAIINYCNNNVKIQQNMSDSGYSYAGGIAGQTITGGKVMNCINYGQITSNSSVAAVQVAGIVGRSSGSIENCVNIGEIYGSSDNMTYSYVGGIVGTNGVSNSNIGIVLKCCNIGKVTANALPTPIVGGIASVNYYKVENSYNIGEINSLKSTYYAGGIVGDNFGDTAIIEKCYSVGEGIINSSNSNGSVVGGHVFKSTTKNCYGIDSYVAIARNVGSGYVVDCALKPSAEMKSQAFVDLLNTNNDDAPWTMDTTNINNGYPILKWQLNSKN